MKTPVLLIHFNRPDSTRRQLTVLESVQPKRLWLLCDGPRAGRHGEAERVDQVRELLSGISWPCEVRRLFRDENLGVATNISEGISWFLGEAGEGIILEDDCLPDPSFFEYAAELLERYRDDERVFSISGYTGRVEDWEFDASYCFSNYFSCWGWATWRRAWDHYDAEMTAFTNKDRWAETFERMNMGARQRAYWNYIFGRVVSGKSDSWAYRFLLSMWANGGLAATPRRNLVDNTGFGEEATNTSGMEERRTVSAALDGPLVHPDRVEADPNVDRWIDDNCHSKSLPVRARWVVRKARHMLGVG